MEEVAAAVARWRRPDTRATFNVRLCYSSSSGRQSKWLRGGVSVKLDLIRSKEGWGVGSTRDRHAADGGREGERPPLSSVVLTRRWVFFLCSSLASRLFDEEEEEERSRMGRDGGGRGGGVMRGMRAVTNPSLHHQVEFSISRFVRLRSKGRRRRRRESTKRGERKKGKGGVGVELVVCPVVGMMTCSAMCVCVSCPWLGGYGPMKERERGGGKERRRSAAAAAAGA